MGVLTHLRSGDTATSSVIGAMADSLHVYPKLLQFVVMMLRGLPVFAPRPTASGIGLFDFPAAIHLSAIHLSGAVASRIREGISICSAYFMPSF